ncbi:unnamed protein product [Aphanomyces euteiches]
MVVRKKQGGGGGGASKTGPKKDEETAEDANQATGLSLDEYFNSKKAYTLQTMKETSELLEKKEAKLKHDNAMVMSKDDDGDASAEAETIPVVPMHDDVDTEEDPYEDDYESDHGAEHSSSEPNLVAGLTLSDYLTGAATTKPKEKAKKGGPSKKVDEIEGMSLESYLGATSSSSPHDDDRKKKKKPPKIAAAPSIADKKIVVHQPFKKKTSAPNAGSKKLEIHSLKKSDGDVLLFKRDKAHMDKELVHNPLGKNNKHVKPKKKDTDDDSSAMAESHLFHPLPMLTANKSGSLDQPVSISDDDLDISRLPPLPH